MGQSSDGRKRAIVGVPWRGSVSACLAWGDLLVKNIVYKQVLKRLSPPRHHGTPTMAHLQLPEERNNHHVAKGKVRGHT